jgi:hypothetical protein
MILQTDNRLNKNIRDYGCYFMDILYLSNKFTGLQLSVERIERLYKTFVQAGAMTSTCSIKDPNRCFTMAGLQVRYTDKHEKPSRRCNTDEIEILCYYNPDGNGGRGFTHFVVGDGYGHVAYDPIGNSVTVRDGYLKSKRIFKLL